MSSSFCTSYDAQSGEIFCTTLSIRSPGCAPWERDLVSEAGSASLAQGSWSEVGSLKSKEEIGKIFSCMRLTAGASLIRGPRSKVRGLRSKAEIRRPFIWLRRFTKPSAFSRHLSAKIERIPSMYKLKWVPDLHHTLSLTGEYERSLDSVRHHPLFSIVIFPSCVRSR